MDIPMHQCSIVIKHGVDTRKPISEYREGVGIIKVRILLFIYIAIFLHNVNQG